MSIFVKFNRVKINGQTRLYKEIGYGDDYSGSIKLAGTPAMASVRKTINHNPRKDMKKIMVIDGGPRRNMNTAQMLQKVAEGR